MPNITIIAMVAIVVAATVIFVSRDKERAQKTHTTMERSRKGIGAVLLVIVSWTFLRSGKWYLILGALLMVSLATIYILVEKPHKEMV